MQPLTRPWLRKTLTKCQSWWITLCEVSLWSSFLKPYWDPVEERAAVTVKEHTHPSKNIWAQVKEVKGQGWEVKEAQLVRCTVSCRWILEHRQLAARQVGWRWSAAVALFHVKASSDRLSPPSSPAKPDDINDNDRCHVLSYLALHRLNSETGQVIYYHRYFTAPFTLIWRIYVWPTTPPVQCSCSCRSQTRGVWERRGNSWVESNTPPQVGREQANL